RLGSVLLGVDVSADDISAELEEYEGGASAWLPLQGQEGCGWVVSYFQSDDRLIVHNECVTRNTQAAENIGFDAAKAIFEATFWSAVDSGAIDTLGVDSAAARPSATVQGEGICIANFPEPAYCVRWTESAKEYIFSAPRMLRGINVVETGLSISVHRVGQLALLETYGVKVHSKVSSDGKETPTADGYMFVRKVTAEECDRRAQAEYGDGIVESLGFGYWLPENAASRVVEPMQMYQGGRFMVAYPVSDPGGTPVVWPEGSGSDDPGDSRLE
ncbi:MAG: hypothetical protein FWD57_06695, partial [Polyangiaceae bacterium]|nr:hypothetical protein [Polyangiaceae bacterium]